LGSAVTSLANSSRSTHVIHPHARALRVAGRRPCCGGAGRWAAGWGMRPGVGLGLGPGSGRVRVQNGAELRQPLAGPHAHSAVGAWRGLQGLLSTRYLL